jgi:hypothetical protein
MNLSKLLALLLCLGMTTPLYAGVIMTMVDNHSQHPGDQSTNRIYLDKDRVRMEITGSSDNRVALYRQDKNLFWILDLKEKTYLEFTKADVERMGQQMDGAMKQMEEAMKDMPPEQRAMMEGMMKGKMPASESKVTFKKVASGQQVGQWTCAQYQGDRNGKKVQDVWTTDWKSLGITESDFTVLMEMSKFWEGLSKFATSHFKISGDQAAEDQYPGVPVKTVDYEDGKAAGSSELQGVQRQDLDAAMFNLPAGFKKEAIPTGEMDH